MTHLSFNVKAAEQRASSGISVRMLRQRLIHKESRMRRLIRVLADWFDRL